MIYLVLYLTQLQENILNETDMNSPYNFTTEEVSLGYSFYLLLVGIIFLCVNLPFSYLTQRAQDPDLLWRKRKAKSHEETADKEVAGLGLMY